MNQRYTVTLAPAAERGLRNLPDSIRRRIAQCLINLGDDPRPPDARKLSTSRSLYRLREGNFRIVYRIADQILEILVVKIGPRSRIYDEILALESQSFRGRALAEVLRRLGLD